MKDILEYETLLKQDSLRSAVASLIELVCNEKKYQFKKEEFTFDIAELENHAVISINEQHMEIAASAVFFSEFYIYFCNKFEFTLTENVDEAFSFVKKIEQELKTDSFNSGISSFYRRLNRFILFLIHKQFGSDFLAYTLALKKGMESSIYTFNTSYCKILPYLTTSIEIIYQNLKHLMVELTENVTWNANTGAIRQALIHFCQSYPDKGEELFLYAMAQIPVIHNLNSPIIQGLYKVKAEVLWPKLVDLCKNPEHRLSIIGLLYSELPQSEQEADNYWNLVLSFENLSELELMNLPRFYVSMINNKLVNDEIKTQCFSKLEEFILNPAQNVRGVTIVELQQLRGYDEQGIDLLKKLMLTEDFNKDQIALIDHVFFNNKSLTGFFELIRICVAKYGVDFDPQLFSSAFYRFRTEQAEGLSKEVIKLLTDDIGRVRYIGNRIIVHLTPHNGRFLFQTNILEQDALTQYKLWMSVMVETKEPKESLPMLLPLLDSTYGFVQEAFVCKIELLSEEYGSSVIEVLEKELNSKNDYYISIINRIKNYNESFWNEIAKKRGIKEFNPFYTQSKLYHLHSKNFGKTFNKTLSENVGKNSFFMQFATTVILAKGGGWKHEKHSKVEKLGQISSSFQLPRSYFANPDFFDWEVRTSYAENWKNKFKKWEAIISS